MKILNYLTCCKASFNLHIEWVHSYKDVQCVSTYDFSFPPWIFFSSIASLSQDEPNVEFLKYLTIMFAHLVKYFISLIFARSEQIKFIQCATHRTLRILGWFSVIIRRAPATFEALSEIIATIFSILTWLMASSITQAK